MIDAEDRISQLLARLTATVAANVELPAMLQGIADAAVPLFADWCIVDLLEGTQLRRVAVAAIAAEHRRLLEQLAREFPPHIDSPQPAARAVRKRSHELLEHVDDAIVTSHVINARHQEIIAALSIRSHLAVPIQTQARTFGAMSFAYSGSGRQYAHADVVIAESFAQRVALVLERAEQQQKAAASAKRLSELEERLTLALEAGRVGTWDWDLPSGRLLWDERIREIFGVNPDAPVDYKLFESTLHPAHRERVSAAVAQAIGSGSEYAIECQIIRQDDGRERWIEATGRVRYDAKGAPSRFTGTAIDVTERRRLYDELKQDNRRKDEFLAMLGHELRNPLAPIITAIELMQLRGGDDPGARAIIERQARHLARLVDDLLDVSRITRGKIELRQKPLELSTVTARAVEMIRPLVQQKQHHLEVDVPARGLPVNADPDRLAQAVNNLLSNAARYTPPLGHIWLTARASDDAITLEVADDGIGIPAELLPDIFAPFVQGERTLDRSEGGLGIGLTVVKNLVELHGGRVAAESPGRDQGSRFSMTLPRFAGPVDVISQAVRPPSQQPRRVLVVDDNPDAAVLISKGLRAFGHDVALAHDGEAALRVATEFVPEVAVLDIGLAGMDGYTLAEELRLRFASLRLIALTGYGQQSDRKRSAQAGFEVHLVKPVQLDVLAAHITPRADRG